MASNGHSAGSHNRADDAKRGHCLPSDQDYGEQLGDVVERILDAVVENVGGAAGSLQSQRLQPPPVRQPNHRATTSLISNRRAASPQGGCHNPADVRSALDVHPRRHRLPDRLPTQPRRVGQHAPLVALSKPRVRTIPGRVEGADLPLRAT